MGKVPDSGKVNVLPPRKVKREGSMENRTNRPRRTTDLDKSGTKETRLASDKTPLPDKEPPDPSWASLGVTRILNPAEETGMVARELEKPGTGKQSVLGEFRLLKKLGEGAMGAVFLARQPSFDNRQVALKVLFPHVANNQKLVRRLEREAEAMFDLDHPNIVKSFAVGEDKNWHYIAMEYVNGDSLQKTLNQQGQFSVADALYITLACARALEYAHAKGIIHRDIKPDNVLLTQSGDVKVTDLGMVKKLDEDEEKGLTMTGHAVGTPWYMPLEQARNAKDADGRCDIYALGCMLYCLVTGHPPFTGQTIVEVIQAKEIGTFPPARSSNQEVPEKLDIIIAKMAHKQAKHRYQNCTDLIRDLESLGLAGDKLELVVQDSSAPTTPRTPAGSRSMINTIATPLPTAQTADEWFVQLKKDSEKTIKMSSTQIKDFVRAGKLGSSVQISRYPDRGFGALASYKEFEAVASQQRSQKGFAQKNSAMRTLSKKIDEAERQREERDEKDYTTFKYWLQIFLQCLALVAGVGFIGYGIYWLIKGLFP